VSVRKIYNQEAQHDSGMILRSIDHETMQVEHQGHTLTLDVDRGLKGELFYLPAALHWDDGAPIPSEIAELIKPAITEIENFWNRTLEFRTLGV
jgi:hypothetical protein